MYKKSWENCSKKHNKRVDTIQGSGLSIPTSSHVASSGLGQIASMHEAELAGLHQSTAQGLLVGDHNSLLNNMAGGNNIFDTRHNNRLIILTHVLETITTFH